jgi:hypothetical protein
MATTKEEIRGWLNDGLKQGCTHVIIVCDTFDWDDYPVYISPLEDVRNKVAEYNGKNMQKIMEIYNLKLPIENQLAENRVYNL